MKRLALWIALSCVVAPLEAAGQAAPVTGVPPEAVATPTIARPDWLQRPTGDDVVRVYPRLATRRNISASVILVCRVKADGWLELCEVRSEYPAGYGFGEAAIKLGKLFRMRETTADGVSVEGASVRIPLVFMPS